MNQQNNEYLISQIKNAPKGMLKKVDVSEVFNSVSNDVTNEQSTQDADNSGINNDTVNNNNFDGNNSQPFQSNLPLGGNYVNFGNLLNAEMVVNITDELIPALMVIILGFFGLDMKRSELQATAKQKAGLIPPTELLMQKMGINVNSPIAAWFIAVSAVYAPNAIEKALTKKFNEKDKKKSNVVISKTPPPENNAPRQHTNVMAMPNISTGQRGGAREGAGRKPKTQSIITP